MIAVEPALERAKFETVVPAKKQQTRLAFLDWTRGLGAVIMLQGHVFHSFAKVDRNQNAAYVYSQFFGGITPAIFLFLTGITFAMGMERTERRALSGWGRIAAALHRSRYLFILAALFRLQLWFFGRPESPWTDLFKVDILNCMGLTMALLAPLAAVETGRRIRLAALAGLGIAAFSPLMSAVDLGWMHPFAQSYFVPSYNGFSVFPWGAFLAFGVAAGSLLRLVRREEMGRLMQWGAIAGFGMVLASHYLSEMPYTLYAKSEYWLNSPALVITKLGVVLLIAAAAYLWIEHGWITKLSRDSFSWVRQLGTTSLLVYWVHIELVYGRWFGRWKENLSVPQCLGVAAALTLLMLGLSVARTRWPEWRAAFEAYRLRNSREWA